MNKVWIVAQWEFFKNLKLKQEIIGYVMMALIYAALAGVQVWQSEAQKAIVNLGVVGDIEAKLPDNIHVIPVSPQEDSLAYLNYLQQHELDGVLVSKPQWRLILPNTVSWSEQLIAALEVDAREKLLQKLNLDREQLDLLQHPMDVDIVNMAEQNVGADAEMLSILVAILTAMAVFNSFGLCMMSVTQEKQHRVTEQLLTCVNFQQWIDGKALGLCLSSLKSLITTMLFMIVIFTAISVLNRSSGFDLALSGTPIFSIATFCVLGIILWNYLFVGFSATIDDINHSGKTSIMFLPALPVMLVFMVLDDPAGDVARALSIFPLTSISFMPARLSSMDVPYWELGLSLLCLLITIWFVRLYATRIFRANITLFGKEPTWYQIWKSMRDKSI